MLKLAIYSVSKITMMSDGLSLCKILTDLTAI